GGEVFGAAFIAENDFEDDTPAPVAGCAAGSEDFAERPGRIVEFGPSTVRALRVQTRPCPGVRPEKYVRADTEERLLASGRFRAKVEDLEGVLSVEASRVRRSRAAIGADEGLGQLIQPHRLLVEEELPHATHTGVRGQGLVALFGLQRPERCRFRE